MRAFLKRIFGKKEVDDWKLVKTLKINSLMTSKKSPNGVQCWTYFHLHESKFGKRKYEFTSTYPSNFDPDVKKGLTEYHETVFPWVNGRYFPDIPRYQDMELINVQEKLSAQ